MNYDDNGRVHVTNGYVTERRKAAYIRRGGDLAVERP